jgi:hypothetical protein
VALKRFIKPTNFLKTKPKNKKALKKDPFSNQGNPFNLGIFDALFKVQLESPA